MAEKRVIELELKNNIDDSANSVKSLKAQLREAQADVAILSDKFGVASKEAVNAAKKAAELADKIGDAKALTDAFNPDAKFKALTSSLGGVAGGFAAVQGGMALFGKQSEDVEKTLLKVQSAMALSEGIQSVGESVDSFRQLGAVIKNNVIVQNTLTAAQAAYTFVVGATTGALKVLRIALAATGIGAIVVALGLLIANFDKVKSAVLNLVPGLASVGKIFGKVVDAVTDFVGATSDASRTLDKLKKDADATLNINKKFLSEHGDQIDKYTKQKIDAKNAYAAAVKEDGANQVELAKRLNREIAAIDAERNAERAKINQDAIDKENERREKAEAKRIENEAKNAKLEKERFTTRQAEIDDYNKTQEELQAEKDALKAEQDTNKNKLDFSKGMEILQAKKSLLDEGTQNEKDAAEARKAIQEAQLNLASQGIGFLKDIAGKNVAIQKAALIAESAVAIARIIINTRAANAKAVALSPATFGQPMVAINTISGVLSVASTLLATKKALTSLGGGSAPSAPSLSGGGGGGGGGAEPAQSAAPQFNVVGTSGANQIAQTLGNQAPVKAYVVSNDVTTAQGLDRNIVKTATLGG